MFFTQDCLVFDIACNTQPNYFDADMILAVLDNPQSNEGIENTKEGM